MRRPVARVALESSETFVALLCALSSATFLFGIPQPASIDALLPWWLRVTWGAYLFLGGALTAAGVMGGWRAIERAGLILLAGPAGVYGLAVIVFGHARGLFPAAVIFAFAAAFAVRASDRLQSSALRVLGAGDDRHG